MKQSEKRKRFKELETKTGIASYVISALLQEEIGKKEIHLVKGLLYDLNKLGERLL